MSKLGQHSLANGVMALLTRKQRDDLGGRMPKPISRGTDAYVGSRVRLRRKLIGMSQSMLAESIGVTYQQVQKYERGHNRISASALYNIARALGVDMGFFFEGLPQSGESLAEHADESTMIVSEFIRSRAGIALARAFCDIQSSDLRAQIADLARCLADNQN